MRNIVVGKKPNAGRMFFKTDILKVGLWVFDFCNGQEVGFAIILYCQSFQSFGLCAIFCECAKSESC